MYKKADFAMNETGFFFSLLATSEQPPHGEVLPAEISHKEEDVGGLDNQRPDTRFGYLRHAYIQGDGQERIATDGLHIVRDRMHVLTDEVGEEHAGGIAAEAGPCTGYVAILRHEDYVDSH